MLWRLTLGSSSWGSRKCQTVAASPAEPGGLLSWSSLGMSHEFVESAVKRGDLCIGYVEKGCLVSYLWIGVSSTPMEAGLWVRFGNGHSYGYKSFTLPTHRGKRLQQLLVHQSDRWLPCLEASRQEEKEIHDERNNKQDHDQVNACVLVDASDAARVLGSPAVVDTTPAGGFGEASSCAWITESEALLVVTVFEGRMFYGGSAGLPGAEALEVGDDGYIGVDPTFGGVNLQVVKGEWVLSLSAAPFGVVDVEGLRAAMTSVAEQAVVRGARIGVAVADQILFRGWGPALVLHSIDPSRSLEWERRVGAMWGFWPTSMILPGPGCYAIQIDTESKSDIVVFEVTLK